ncbi:hypothetical protein [Cognatilysobacter bugurensis]|uniref:Tryptophan-rich sensory protein n=1 Tax=Cognatilysobacter bugurensis TaxID=543356 RepID=A0A918T026_9GAMM|nr:hypothetical protein [Lysobacter bugurensis]GHA79581.1 hypothetical protein GCM10007067_16390 [Lysobacter bugurensis]
MRLLVVLMSIAMPLVAWLSQRGAFGPTQDVVSDAFPTLLVAAGYAFSIWGLIFALDVAYAIWQATGERRRDPTLARVAPLAAAGFALTAVWMPLFSMGLFGLCVLVIFAALACTARAAVVLSRDAAPVARQRLWAWLPLSLHAGWLSLAAFLNVAQTIVAYRMLPVDDMLGWSAVLFVLAAVVLLVLNARMRGNVAYVAAAVWGLAAVVVRQSQGTLDGSQVAAGIALVIAVVLIGQTLWLRFARPRVVEAAHTP